MTANPISDAGRQNKAPSTATGSSSSSPNAASASSSSQNADAAASSTAPSVGGVGAASTGQTQSASPGATESESPRNKPPTTTSTALVPAAPSSSGSSAAARPVTPRGDEESTGCCGGGSERKGAKLNPTLKPSDFKLLKVIGKGSFGKVFQVQKIDTGKIYAMKVLKKDQLLKRKQVAHTQTERRVLESIDHPFIVSLRYAFQTQDKLYMVLDYFTGGELFFHLKLNGRFSEELARFYAAEICMALEYLHKNTIVYRDLKPENVLLDEEGHIRLTDFGLSKESITGDTLTHTFCGTPEYLAPEVINGAGYNQAVDWWSLGTLLYEMLAGLPPFFSQNVHHMYEKIMRQQLTFPRYFSPEAVSILTGLLQRDPTKRLGAGPGDAAELKAHPFFKGIDWDALYRKEVTPPFRPYTRDGALDTSNIDEEFKNEVPHDTPVNPSALQTQINFPGFTYEQPQSLSEQLGEDDGDEGLQK